MNYDYMHKLLSLEGKNAIITGGSQGIGKGIAISLAQFGCAVTICGRNDKLLAETKTEIEAFGGQCETSKFDISKEEEVERFFADYRKSHDKLDIYIGNAGYTIHKPALETTSDEIDGLYATNFKGTIFGVSRAAEMMKPRKCGNIVVITSVNALYPLPSQGVYTTTKCALEGLIRCVAADLSKYGIRVNTMAPGGINTNMNHDMFVDPELRAKFDPLVPLGHIGTIEEMGDVVACMVSDAFRYMTGSTVLVDGGLMLRMQ